MSKILSVSVNPHTKDEYHYEIGMPINIGEYTGGYAPTISEIKISVSKETNYPIIEIFVGGECYCVFENVKYAVYYETSYHTYKL